ncbi:hypothetical protein CYMTET_56606, partial [Cymbomonas tetramitiformis]
MRWFVFSLLFLVVEVRGFRAVGSKSVSEFLNLKLLEEPQEDQNLTQANLQNFPEKTPLKSSGNSSTSTKVKTAKAGRKKSAESSKQSVRKFLDLRPVNDGGTTVQTADEDAERQSGTERTHNEISQGTRPRAGATPEARTFGFDESVPQEEIVEAANGDVDSSSAQQETKDAVGPDTSVEERDSSLSKAYPSPAEASPSLDIDEAAPTDIDSSSAQGGAKDVGGPEAPSEESLGSPNSADPSPSGAQDAPDSASNPHSALPERETLRSSTSKTAPTEVDSSPAEASGAEQDGPSSTNAESLATGQSPIATDDFKNSDSGADAAVASVEANGIPGVEVPSTATVFSAVEESLAITEPGPEENTASMSASENAVAPDESPAIEEPPSDARDTPSTGDSAAAPSSSEFQRITFAISYGQDPKRSTASALSILNTAIAAIEESHPGSAVVILTDGEAAMPKELGPSTLVRRSIVSPTMTRFRNARAKIQFLKEQLESGSKQHVAFMDYDTLVVRSIAGIFKRPFHLALTWYHLQPAKIQDNVLIVHNGGMQSATDFMEAVVQKALEMPGGRDFASQLALEAALPQIKLVQHQAQNLVLHEEREMSFLLLPTLYYNCKPSRASSAEARIVQFKSEADAVCAVGIQSEAGAVCAVGIQSEADASEAGAVCAVGIPSEFDAVCAVGIQSEAGAVYAVDIQSEADAVCAVGIQSEADAVCAVGIQSEFDAVCAVGIQSEAGAVYAVDIQSEADAVCAVGIQSEPGAVCAFGIQSEADMLCAVGIQSEAGA